MFYWNINIYLATYNNSLIFYFQQSCVSDLVNVLATADMRGSVSVKYIAKNTLCGADPGKFPLLHTYVRKFCF